MDDLIKLVRTFRVTAGLTERLSLADAICRLIAPDLRFYVFSLLVPQAAEEVSQDVLISVARSLNTFKGNTKESFWDFCYTIADRRVYDHIQKRDRDRLQPMSSEELLDLIDESVHVEPLSAGDRHDLEYALKLLDSSKPECRGYLLDHYITGFKYTEIAEKKEMEYDNVRMKIARCLEEAQALVS
jgi:RNA polymerase sigma factor (sigma-70 family)